MSISRDTYDDLRLGHAEQRGVSQALEKNLIALQTTMDWMRVRLSQLEHERALLVQHFMGISLPVPTIERTPTKREQQMPLDVMPSFEDVGDDEAGRLGITHNADGTVSYK